MRQKKRAKQALEALNIVAVALTDHNHHWTRRERYLYGRAASFLTAFSCGAD